MSLGTNHGHQQMQQILGGASGDQAKPEPVTLMQGLRNDLEMLLAGSRISLGMVESQRGRLMADIQPSPGPAGGPVTSEGSSSTVSFGEIGRLVEELRIVLGATHEHLVLLKQIG